MAERNWKWKGKTKSGIPADPGFLCIWATVTAAVLRDGIHWTCAFLRFHYYLSSGFQSVLQRNTFSVKHTEMASHWNYVLNLSPFRGKVNWHRNIFRFVLFCGVSHKSYQASRVRQRDIFHQMLILFLAWILSRRVHFCFCLSKSTLSSRCCKNWTFYFSFLFCLAPFNLRIFFQYTNLCRSQWPRGLRRRSSAARLLRLWVRFPPGAWMFVVRVVCCQVEVSATDWSLVQRSPTDCGASLCVIKKPRKRGG